jgi:hypothetical protein
VVDSARRRRDARGVIVFLVRHAHAIEERRDLPDTRGRSARPAAGRPRLGRRLRWHDCTPTAVWTTR